MFINNQHEVLRYRKQMIKRPQWSCMRLEPSIEREGCFQPKLSIIAASPFSRQLDCSTQLVRDVDGLKHAVNFTREVINIDIDKKRIRQFKARDGVRVVWGESIEVFVKAGIKWQSMMTGEQVDEPANARKFILTGATPSQMRQEVVTLVDVTDGVDDVKLLYDIITTGSASEVEGKPVSLPVGSKLQGRHTMPKAPSTRLGSISSYAIYDGLFGEEDGWSPVDGTAYARAADFAEVISEYLGIRVSARAVVGLVFQGRPSGCIKACFVVVEDDFIEGMLAINPDLWRIYRSAEDQELPAMIVDKNTLKAEFDFSREIFWEVLDVSRLGRANTSMQVLQKLAASPFIDRKEFITYMRNVYRSDVDGVFDSLRSNKPRVLGLKAYKGKVFAPQVLASKVPGAVMSDLPLFNAVVIDGYMEHMANNANRLYHPLRGGYSVLQQDPSTSLGALAAIRYGEAFLPGEEGQKLRGKCIVVFKYPTIGTGEFYRARVITTEDIYERLSGLSDVARVRRAILSFYRFLQPGAIVLPPIRWVNKLLAGMDTDFDQALWIEESEEGCMLFGKCRPCIVDIQNDLPANNQVVGEYSVETMGQFAVDTIVAASAGSSVGVITRQNDCVIAMMTEPFDVQVKILEKVVGSHYPRKEYVGLTYDMLEIDGCEVQRVVVKPSDIRRLESEIRESKWTPESMRKILDDLNALFRLLQEMTIDCVKTGVVVKNPFNFLKHVELKQNQRRDLRPVRNEDGTICNIEIGGM